MTVLHGSILLLDTTLYIPSASFGRVTKIIFLVDQHTQPAGQHNNNDNDTDDVSDDTSTDGDMPRSSSVGDIPIVLTPRSVVQQQENANNGNNGTRPSGMLN